MNDSGLVLGTQANTDPGIYNLQNGQCSTIQKFDPMCLENIPDDYELRENTLVEIFDVWQIDNNGKVYGTQYDDCQASLWATDEEGDLYEEDVINVGDTDPPKLAVWNHASPENRLEPTEYINGITDVNDQGALTVTSAPFDSNGDATQDWEPGFMNNLSAGVTHFNNDILSDAPMQLNNQNEMSSGNNGIAQVRQNGSGVINLGPGSPYAINNQSVVVGTTVNFSEAMIWQKPSGGGSYQAQKLNDLIMPNSGWQLKKATDINNKGVIIGSGTKGGQDKGFLAVPIDITNVWSDQLTGVHANWIQKADDPNEAYMTGRPSKPYILMGARNDDKAYVKAKTSLPLPQELDEYLLFRLMVKNQTTPKSGNSSYNPGNGEISITAQGLDNTEKDYIIVAGGDSNGDSQLDDDEVTYKNEWVFKIVPQNKYDQSKNQLNQWVTQNGDLPQASALLHAFATATTPSGANAATIDIPRDEYGLSHAVGILFTPEAGPGSSINAVFGPGSPMSDQFVASATFSGQLMSFFSTKIDEVYTRFSGSTNLFETFIWQMPPLDLAIFPGDVDLFLALAKVRSQGTITLQVKVEALNLQTVEVKVTGTVVDLYDFDYDGPESNFVKPASCVQAGYNTLGNGGRVFKSEIQMNNSLWPGVYSFYY